jgi:hypothetical protein
VVLAKLGYTAENVAARARELYDDFADEEEG